MIYDLNAIVLAVCIAVAAVVFGIMFCSIVRHRRVAGREAKQFHGSVVVEIFWSIIPCFIVIGLAYPAVRTVIDRQQASKRDRPETKLVKDEDPVRGPGGRPADANPSRRTYQSAPHAGPLMDPRR